MSVAVERETGGCWERSGKPHSHTLSFLLLPCFASQLLLCAQFPCWSPDNKSTRGFWGTEAWGHWASLHSEACDPLQYRLPNGQTPFPSSVPHLLWQSTEQMVFTGLRRWGQGAAAAATTQTTPCLIWHSCWRRWRGGKQPHQSLSNHLSFPFKNVTAAPSVFYNNVYHCSSIVWDNKWLEMSIYHQEISACPFPQAVS